MARRGQSLRELARLANVTGDIRAGQFYDRKRKDAEALLSRMTDEAKNAASSNYAGEGLIEGIKFLGKFIPGIGTAVSTVASAADAIKDKQHQKQSTQGLEAMRSKIPKGMYGDYLSQNFEALLSQVEQSQKASANKSLISNLLGIGVGTGAVDNLLSPTVQKTLEKYLPQLELRDKIPGEKLTDAKLPSLFDYFQLLEPQAMKMLRGRQEATSPQAPYMQRPSFQRRIR
tara:strand:- start:10288 stop:10977 length:690 start_codon:yes stop_codon:yes gene_type:complete